MEKRDNYAVQVQQAKQWFLRYDQDMLIEKCGLSWDKAYLYVPFFGRDHRIDRKTGDLEARIGENWVGANSHAEVMTLLDLICDSRDGRFVTGRWQSMESFGLMFHQNLLQDKKDPWADRFDRDPEGFRSACGKLGGTPIPAAIWATGSRFSKACASVSSSGTATRNSVPGCATSGTKTP